MSVLYSAENREFAIETIRLDQHQVSLVSLENPCADAGISPGDRYDRVESVMSDSDLTVLEYFPQEVQESTYSLPLIGSIVRKTIGVGPQYGILADRGHAMGSMMGCADIANGPKFAPLEVNTLSVFSELAFGVRNVIPTRREKLIPAATNARRVITAAAIRQELDRHKDGMSITYVGAPAHVNRVRSQLTKEQTVGDRARLAHYLGAMTHLDAGMRLYEPVAHDWKLTAYHPVEADLPERMGKAFKMLQRIIDL